MLVVERAPVPVPAPDEVLVAVHAAAITFDELTWEETWTREGVSVSEIASGVTDFKPGDLVYGLIGFDRDGAAAVRSDGGELVRGFGAARVIDVRSEAFDESDLRYDVVIDTVGGETLERSFGVLRRGGRLVTLSAPPPAGKADEYGVIATFFIVTPNRDQLAELAALVDSHRLHVEVAGIFAG